MELGKDKDALKSFWLQLKTNEQMARGIRIKDMPKDWFVVPNDDKLSNSMTAADAEISISYQN